MYIQETLNQNNSKTLIHLTENKLRCIENNIITEQYRFIFISLGVKYSTIKKQTSTKYQNENSIWKIEEKCTILNKLIF